MREATPLEEYDVKRLIRKNPQVSLNDLVSQVSIRRSKAIIGKKIESR